MPKVVCVCTNAVFRAKITPEVAGKYEWKITKGEKRSEIVGSNTSKSVEVHGIEASKKEDDVKIKLKFWPEGAADWCCPAFHEFTILKVELEQTDSNAPLAPINRICSNAQKKYKNVDYKINITPAKDASGNHFTVKAEISGNAGVTFKDGSTKNTGLKNGNKVTLVAPDDAIGTWNLTAECEQHTACKAEAEEQVFKFVMDEEYAAFTYRENSVSPTGLDDYGWQNHAVLGYQAKGPPNYVTYAANDDNCLDTAVDFKNDVKYSAWGWESGADFGVFLHNAFGVDTEPAGCYSGEVSTKVTIMSSGESWVNSSGLSCTSWWKYHVELDGANVTGFVDDHSEETWTNEQVRKTLQMTCGERDGELVVETHSCAQRQSTHDACDAGVKASQSEDLDDFEIVGTP